MGRIAAFLADALAVARLALEALAAGRAVRGGRQDAGARGLPDPPPGVGAALAVMVGAEGAPLAEPEDEGIPGAVSEAPAAGP